MLHNASMHAHLSPEKDSFFCHWDSRKGDKTVEAELVLAALKKQAPAGLTLHPYTCWLWERAWCQVDLPSVLGRAVSHMRLGGCEAVPAVVAQAFGRVVGPPQGCFEQVLWTYLNLEVNKKHEYRTDTCPVPSHKPKDIHFPMSFSSVGPLRPSIPKFSEWSLCLSFFLELLTSPGCFGFRYRGDYPWLLVCPLVGSITTAAFSFGSLCVGGQKAEEECRVMIWYSKSGTLSRVSPESHPSLLTDSNFALRYKAFLKLQISCLF